MLPMFSLPTSLAWAHPLVAEWFVRKFGTPTEPQEQGWPHILAGRTTLISAPTGSGKTLAAFLACIDRLVRKALAGDLNDRTEVLYVSPLKALGNDIQKNLEVPLSEILQMAGERGLLMPEIRTAVRTGDTLMHERRAMLKRPPHILVTTPESLYILLTAEKSRAILRDVETVIVDEIHAVADDKRGAHLTLSLERLEALTYRPPVRIGLSATQKPIDEVAHFLEWVDFAGNGVQAPVAPVTDNGLTFPNFFASPLGALVQPSLIFPVPCEFISPSLPHCSVIRPLTDKFGGGVATIVSFTADGLFFGQSKEFLNVVNQIAAEADAAVRQT